MFDKKNYHFLLLGIVCFFTFFINNGVIYPDIMESRNLVTANEMVQYDNWMVPTMNGDLRLEKPPLPTWIAAGVDIISPDNVPLQRAAVGLAATLLVLFLYLFATGLMHNRLYGLLASLVICTSFNVILMGRTASWDIYCHSFMMGAIYFIYRAFDTDGPGWNKFLWAGLFLGLSFLGKGPVSFYALLLPFLIAYIIIYRPSLKQKYIPLLLMILTCLVVSLWWPVYLYFYHRDMALLVAAKESTAWMERNVRPWYYYWKFFLESGIWSAFLVTAFVWPYWKKKITMKKEYIFTLLWTFGVLILLSLLPEKKTRYLLPILIPAALVVAHLFVYWIEELRKGKLSRTDNIIFKVNSLLIAVIAFVIPVGVYILFYAEGHMGISVFIVAVLLFLMAACFLLKTSLKVRPLQFLWSIVFLFIIVETVLLPYVANLFNNMEIKSIRAVRNVEEIKDLPFYYPADEELRIELVYEAGRRIQPWAVGTDTTLLKELPVVLVSGKRAEEILPEAILEKVELQQIDVYDDNHRPKDTRWYSDKFIRHVTVLREKK